MSKLQAHLRLIRWDKPVGTLLTMWPGLWSLTMHAPGVLPPAALGATFIAGAFFMRSAGCAVNDMWDSDFDAKVERTKDRPIASGELTKFEAAGTALVTSCGAAACLPMLNGTSQALALSVVVPVVLYPAMKRVTNYPQVVLGLVFNWGALLGSTAMVGHITPSAAVLYAGCVAWTVCYDTIYALQDRNDDSALGLKSTALTFGPDRLPYVIPGLSLATAALFETSAFMAFGEIGALCMLPSSAFLIFSAFRFDYDDKLLAGRYFQKSTYVGPLVFTGIVASKWLSEAGSSLTSILMAAT